MTTEPDASGSGAPEPRAAEPDTSAIHGLLARMTEAWNSGDATAYAEQFTPDAEYISWLGTRDTGRAAIEATHRFLFDGPLKGVKLAGGATAAPEIRYLTPDVALVITDGAKPDHAPDPSVVTLTAVRQDGRWRLACFQNTRKTPLPAR